MKPQKVMASRTIKLYNRDDLDGITYIQTDLVLDRSRHLRDDYYRYDGHINTPTNQNPSFSEHYNKVQSKERLNNSSPKGASVNVNSVKVNVVSKSI